MPLPDEEDSAVDDLLKPSLTIKQFCVRETMSLASYYKMKRLGYGPREMVVPGTEIIRITPTAHREWREKLEARSRTEEAELERKRRADQRRAAGKTAAASPLHVSRKAIAASTPMPKQTRRRHTEGDGA
jgi:hypothetical protein